MSDPSAELESLKRENARLRKLLKLTDAEAAPTLGTQTAWFDTAPGSVDARSSSEAKVEFYAALFGARRDVYAVRWENGRTGRSISADLDQIGQYFKLVRTYHDAAVGVPPGSAPIIDPTQAAAISYIVAHPGMQLVMGTNNNAVASGGFGTAWSAGLMTSSTYTDQWVQMIIGAFGGVANVQGEE